MNFNDHQYEVMLKTQECPYKQDIMKVYNDALNGNGLAIRNMIRWHLTDSKGYLHRSIGNAADNYTSILSWLYFARALGLDVSGEYLITADDILEEIDDIECSLNLVYKGFVNSASKKAAIYLKKYANFSK